MTRQKKELIKKIDKIENFIRADIELGAGFAPEGAYDAEYEEVYKLQEELARLSHYDCVTDMLFDMRGCFA